MFSNVNFGVLHALNYIYKRMQHFSNMYIKKQKLYVKKNNLIQHNLKTNY